VPSFVGAGDRFSSVFTVFFGEGVRIAVSPLDKARAVQVLLQKEDSANVPGVNFLMHFVVSLRSGKWVWAVDPSRHISQYAHNAWRIRTGVLSGDAVDVTQNTEGYLVVGTRSAWYASMVFDFVPWTPSGGKAFYRPLVALLFGRKRWELMEARRGLGHGTSKKHLTND